MSTRREFLTTTLVGGAAAAVAPRRTSAAPKTMTVVHESSFIKGFDDYVDYLVIGTYDSPYLMGDPASTDPDLHFDVRIGENVAVPAGVLRGAAFRGDHDIAVAGLPVEQREDEPLARLPAGRRQQQPSGCWRAAMVLFATVR